MFFCSSDVIAAFCRAVAKALDWVESHTDREVAQAIIGQFPDTDLDLSLIHI